MRVFRLLAVSIAAAPLTPLQATAAEADAQSTKDGPPAEVLQRELRAMELRIRQLESERAAQKNVAADRAAARSPGFKLGDGVVLEDESGDTVVRLTARGMADYRDYAEAAAKADTFAVRRARIGMGVQLGRQFGGFVEAELAFGSATQAGNPATGGLLQGFFDWTPSPRARLRIGQFKPQFMLEATMSPFHTDFQERSLAFNLLQNFLYDRGAMLHGAPFDGTYYALSYTNGTGINIDEFQRNALEAASAAKDVTVRVVADAARWAGLGNSVLHFGGSVKQGDVANGDGSTAGYAAASGLTEGRGLVFFNPVPFNTGSPQAANRIERSLGALEFAIAHRQFKVQGEIARAGYAGTLANGFRFDRDISAGYLAASWLISGEHFADSYRNGVFTRIRPHREFARGTPGAGAWQASLRYSFFDGGDFDAANPVHTGVLGGNTLAPPVTRSTARADAMTVALKWMPTAYTAVMVNYVQTDFDTPVVASGATIGREHALTLRAQFDFF